MDQQVVQNQINLYLNICRGSFVIKIIFLTIEKAILIYLFTVYWQITTNKAASGSEAEQTFAVSSSC